MQRLVGLFIYSCIFLSGSWAYTLSTHLEQLRERYPYGLIGEDYSLLNEEDLAINTCNVEVTPFSKNKNMAYSYWQCFSLKNTEMRCDSLGYDLLIKKETGYMEISTQDKGGTQSYLARDAMDMQSCRKWLQVWREKTQNEKYVCLSGSYNTTSNLQNDKAETNWVFDKFKTRKGCESFFVGECRLQKHPAKTCILPRNGRHTAFR